MVATRRLNHLIFVDEAVKIAVVFEKTAAVVAKTAVVVAAYELVVVPASLHMLLFFSSLVV